jgi:C-terminal processing protease CtpA/Prc
LCVLPPQVGSRLAAAASAALLVLGGAPPLPSQAVTAEQLLFLEAWRAVDRAYVDKSFNGQSWFKVRVELCTCCLVAAAALHALPCAGLLTRLANALPHTRRMHHPPTQLRESYLKSESMPNRPATYDAIRKLLATLDDPFTRFLEPSRLAALRRGTAGVR